MLSVYGVKKEIHRNDKEATRLEAEEHMKVINEVTVDACDIRVHLEEGALAGLCRKRKRDGSEVVVPQELQTYKATIEMQVAPPDGEEWQIIKQSAIAAAGAYYKTRLGVMLKKNVTPKTVAHMVHVARVQSAYVAGHGRDAIERLLVRWQEELVERYPFLDPTHPLHLTYLEIKNFCPQQEKDAPRLDPPTLSPERRPQALPGLLPDYEEEEIEPEEQPPEYLIIEKVASLVAKKGNDFEDKLREKEGRFEFLNSAHRDHQIYKRMLQQCQASDAELPVSY